MGRRREFDDGQVLDSVRDQFWAKGYAATSVDDLVHATGLGKGSLYGAFGGKRQLFMMVLETYATARVEEVRAALAGSAPAVDRLRALLRVVPADPGPIPFDRGCFLANTATELAARDGDVLDRARRAYASVEGLITAAVQEAVDEGGLPAATDAPALGRLLLAVQQGMEFLKKTGMSAEDLDGVGVAAADRLLR
jgi:TetR/AcrR family transcriptional regulator, transcriptional repressor for nem operon